MAIWNHRTVQVGSQPILTRKSEFWGGSREGCQAAVLPASPAKLGKKLSHSFIYVSDLENYKLNYLNVPLLLNYWAFIVRTVIIQELIWY